MQQVVHEFAYFQNYEMQQQKNIRLTFYFINYCDSTYNTINLCTVLMATASSNAYCNLVSTPAPPSPGQYPHDYKVIL